MSPALRKPRPEVCLSPTTLDEWLERNSRPATLTDDEPWTGWRLVAAWTAAVVVSWLILYGIGWGIYWAITGAWL